MNWEYFLIAAVLIGALATTVPVFISLFFTGMIGLVWLLDIDPQIVIEVLYRSMDKFALVVVLFFVLCGNIMTTGSIVQKLIRTANALVGTLPGGLAMAGVIACGFFGAISGSTVATVEPEIAPKKPQAITPAIARPPGSVPTSALAVRISFCTILPVVMILPHKTKNSTTTRANLSMLRYKTSITICGSISSSQTRPIMPVKKREMNTGTVVARAPIRTAAIRKYSQFIASPPQSRTSLHTQ